MCKCAWAYLCIVEDKELFFKYIKLNYKEDYLKYFDYIDKVFEKGLDYANGNFSLKIKQNYNSSNLFGY